MDDPIAVLPAGEPPGFPQCPKCPYRLMGPAWICVNCASKTLDAIAPRACPICSQRLEDASPCRNALCRDRNRRIERIDAIDGRRRRPLDLRRRDARSDHQNTGHGTIGRPEPRREAGRCGSPPQGPGDSRSGPHRRARHPRVRRRGHHRIPAKRSRRLPARRGAGGPGPRLSAGAGTLAVSAAFEGAPHEGVVCGLSPVRRMRRRWLPGRRPLRRAGAAVPAPCTGARSRR